MMRNLSLKSLGMVFNAKEKITKNYELKLSKFFNSKFAVAVNSGSSANLLMISALIYSKINL